MGLSTLMATRSYMNDVQTELSFEKFPYSGLSKTYCINYQVPDSACTATSILTGVKNNYGTIGLNGNVNLRNCTAQLDNSTHLHSILKYAQDAGKSTGFVTTTRITHATPAATYAKTASRYWESNENNPDECDHRGFSSFQCDECNLSFQRRSALQKHKIQRHETNPGEFKCPECSSIFHKHLHLTKHRADAHSVDLKQFTCRICQSKFIRKSALNAHLYLHSEARQNVHKKCYMEKTASSPLEQKIEK